MDRILLNDFPFNLDFDKIAESMHLKVGSRMHLNLIGNKALILGVGRPKAVIKWVDVNETGEDYAVIDNHRFDSRVMGSNLKGVNKVFLFVVTAGNELRDSLRFSDDKGLLLNYVQNALLMQGYEYMTGYIKETFGIEKLSFMNPGSLPDWDISNNPALIDLIGNVEQDLNVKLTKTGYIDPFESGSGIIFPDMSGYVNCSLCKNYDCIGRRAPFNKAEYEKIFGEMNE